MLPILTHLLAACVGIGFAAWRLKGQRSVKDAIKAVVQGGGGPDPVKPT
jgi:hypothetical protein